MCATSRIIISKFLAIPTLMQIMNIVRMRLSCGHARHDSQKLTCMNWRVLVIKKHPLLYRESFWEHPLGTITTDGPPKFGPILKSIPK
jgi:hypothetical protein